MKYILGALGDRAPRPARRCRVIGRTINGATLWVDFGGPLVFQPGELAKVLFVVFLAGYLRDNREMLSYGAAGQGRLPSPKHLGPLLLIWGGAMLVLFQTRDLGGALLYFAIFLVMLYTATARWSFVAVGLALFLGRRLRALPGDPARPGPRAELARPLGGPAGRQSYQLVQSLYAISSGGVFGSGLGEGCSSSPEGNTYIPVSCETDFIFSAIAQELGLAGRRRRHPPLPRSSPSAASASRCSPRTASRSSWPRA